MLHYREHKKLAIQGQITAVWYKKHPKTTQSAGAKDNEALSVSSDTCEQAEAGPHHHPSPPSDKSSVRQRKRRIQMSEATQSSENHDNTPAKRKDGCADVEDQEEEESDTSEECQDYLQPQHPSKDSCGLSWESSSWLMQQQELSEHLCHGGLWQDSLSRKFTLDEKNVLLQWCNLHPTRWTSEKTTDTIPPALCPGYYQVTILGINKQIAVDVAYLPVVSANEPRAVGLPQHPHGNTMMSCLSSGFICPLGSSASHSEAAFPKPEAILATAGELEDTHVVCILDLCHLGGDQVEILISKVYRMTDVSID